MHVESIARMHASITEENNTSLIVSSTLPNALEDLGDVAHVEGIVRPGLSRRMLLEDDIVGAQRRLHGTGRVACHISRQHARDLFTTIVKTRFKLSS